MFAACARIFNMEQGAVIEFYFQSGKIATEVYQGLKNVYSDDCLSRVQVFRWFVGFKEGRESLDDDPRQGRPVSARSKENVEKARAIVTQDRQINTRLLAERRGLGKEATRQILGIDFQKRRICPSLCCTLKQFLSFISTSVIQHPPYSPELSPEEFFFPRMKLKREGFSDIIDIQCRTTEQLKGVPLQDCQHFREPV
jgi:hypothetical protein